MKTVAIVGSHPRTRQEFDFNRTDCDIWVFNEALSQGWCNKANVVFQMHAPVIWKNPGNRNDPKHFEWLSSGNTPTIYMMEKYEEVPQAVKYPLDEVSEMVGGKKKFTSSVAYAIALAIYQGYENIEIYGVEMESNTEYQYQRDGVIFWIGVALGKGIKVDAHTRLFDDVLYGYEGSVTVTKEILQEGIKDNTIAAEENKTLYESLLKELREYVKTFRATGEDEGIVPTIGKIATACNKFGLADGYLQECTRYMNKADVMEAETGSYHFSRQEFETSASKMSQESQKEFQKATALSGQMQVIYEEAKHINNKKRRDNKLVIFDQKFMQFVEASAKIGIYAGGAQANMKFLQMTDKLIRAAGGQKSFDVMAEV